MEPSLIGAFIFEPRDKIKMNILNSLILIIDNLDTKQWITGLDVEKADK